MPREVSIVKQISRREIEQHVDRRLIGLTAGKPDFKDVNGLLEYVVDVRIGTKEGQGLIKDVLIAQWAIGIVTDFNVPVVMERSESGALTIIGRSEIRLPDVALRTHTYFDLGFIFMENLVDPGSTNAQWRDAYGHAVDNPEEKMGTVENWIWRQSVNDLDQVDFSDDLPLEDIEAKWEKV